MHVDRKKRKMKYTSFVFESSSAKYTFTNKISFLLLILDCVWYKKPPTKLKKKKCHTPGITVLTLLFGICMVSERIVFTKIILLKILHIPTDPFIYTYVHTYVYILLEWFYMHLTIYETINRLNICGASLFPRY